MHRLSRLATGAVALILIVLGVGLPAQAADTAAPRVVSASVTPTVLDLANKDGQLVVTVQLSDASGVAGPLTVWSVNNQGDWYGGDVLARRSGTATSGTWTVTLDVGRTLDRGPYDFYLQAAADTLGNTMAADAYLGTAWLASGVTGRFGEHTGDGVADLYAVDAQGYLRLYRGASTGLSYYSRYGTGIGFAPTMKGIDYLVQIGDWTGDRRSDVLVRRATDHSLWIYSSDGSGALRPYKQVGSNWGSMTSIVYAGNLGGGSTSYVLGQRADGALFRYRMTTAGLSGTTQVGRGWNGMRTFFSVGDFTGDGKADIIGIRASDGTMWLYPGTSSATLGYGRQVGRGWGSFTKAFSAGDLTGDGRFDMVGVKSTGEVFRYANLGGKWGAATKIGSGFGGMRLMA